MANLSRPLLLTVLLASLSLSASSLPGTATADGIDRDPGKGKDGPRFETVVTTNGQGVWITVRARQSTPGRDPGPAKPADPGQPSSPGSSSTSAFKRSWVDEYGNYFSEGVDGHVYGLLNPGPLSPKEWAKAGAAQHPGAVPRLFTVDGVPQGIVWLPTGASSGNIRWGTPATPSEPPSGDGGSKDPGQVALDVYAHVPLPDIKLKANPGLGLVAMPGWFWVEGYDGSSFGASRTVTLPPEVGPEVPFTEVPRADPRRQSTSFTVDVRVWPTGYAWSFGDSGSLETTSLGKAYPEQSDIQHTYEFSSLGRSEGFPVTMTAYFAAEFRVNGGAPQGLPGMQRTYATGYSVREIQGILTGQ